MEQVNFSINDNDGKQKNVKARDVWVITSFGKKLLVKRTEMGRAVMRERTTKVGKLPNDMD